MTERQGAQVEVREHRPGEYEVEHRGVVRQVLVPAGVGVPGVPEEELVALVVEILDERCAELPASIDVSDLLGSDPTLFEEIARRAEE